MKLILLAFLLATISANAQYAIDWSALDGGGGQSSGGAYAVAGTIGQPDTATSSGGAYILQGGFWSAFASVPSEGVPLLRILRNATNVTLAWPNPSTGFQLQESASLIAPHWTDVNTAPGVIGNEKQVNQAIAPDTRFYRLRKS